VKNTERHGDTAGPDTGAARKQGRGARTCTPPGRLTEDSCSVASCRAFRSTTQRLPATCRAHPQVSGRLPAA